MLLYGDARQLWHGPGAGTSSLLSTTLAHDDIRDDTVWIQGGHRVGAGWVQGGCRVGAGCLKVDTGWTQDGCSVGTGWVQGAYKWTQDGCRVGAGCL